MLLLWILCHLTAVTTMPSSLSRILKTANLAEAGLVRNYRVQREQRICETTYCNEIARKLLQSRNMIVNPCENFYKYVCGSWEKHNPIPNNEVKWSEDQIILNKTYTRIKDVLEERDKPDDIIPVKLAKKHYRTCMDVDAINKRGIKPIQEILNRTGGWPMVMPKEEWDSDTITWQEINKQYIRLFGMELVFSLGFKVDQNDTKRYVLTLSYKSSDSTKFLQSILETEENDSAEEGNDTNEYITGIFHIIDAFTKDQGHTLDQYQLYRDINEMLYFNLGLFEITKAQENIDASSENYTRMTIDELQEWYDSSGVNASTAQFDFLDVIQYAFKTSNISINASEPIVVYFPELLHDLAQLLGKTSQRTLVNYIHWNMVNELLTFTTQEMRDIQFNMTRESYNISSYMPRWKVCVQNMRMDDVVSYMFVKKYTSDDVINKAKEMLEKLREELRNLIMQADWISESGKSSLTQKLNVVLLEIGYPDWYKDDQAMIKHYEGLHIGTDYFQNILNCIELETIRILEQIKRPVFRGQWMEYPITVNAFYDQTTNVIFIPAAQLQDPYFTPLLPDAVNYGVIGFVLGHELSHSFDNEGIQFDVMGHKTAWIPHEIFDKYEEKAMCFVDQYSNYTLDVKDENGQRVQLNGSLTESENIADSIGMQIAFSAYKKLADQRRQTKLPGLENVSNEELFFLAFANSWCRAGRPDYEANSANIDEHSPAEYRIVGSLSNLPAFAQTFECGQNSPMNPQNKCNVWS